MSDEFGKDERMRWDEMDSRLSELYGHTHFTSVLRIRVFAAIRRERLARRNSFMPEALDSIGVASVLTLAGCLWPRALDGTMSLYASGLMLAGAVAFGLMCYCERES